MKLAVRTSAKPSQNLSVWLDAFRAIAAVSVLTGHAKSLMLAGIVPHPSVLLRIYAASVDLICSWPHQAVVIFFVLSGYLVGGPFLVRAVNGTASALDYAAARISRMYTVLLPALVLTLVLDVIGLHDFKTQMFINAHASFFPHRQNLLLQLSPGAFVCNSLFLQEIACRQYGSNMSLWSLSNEAFYYALWMAIIMSRKKIAYCFTIPAMIGIVLYPIFFRSSLPHPGFAALIYGIYFLVWTAGAFASALRPIDRRGALGFFFISMIMYAIFYKFLGATSFVSDLALASAFIPLITVLEGWNVTFPAFKKPIRAVAKISYSLYAIHLPILVLLAVSLGIIRPLPASWFSLTQLMIVTILCIASAAAFWWLFERHTGRVKKALSEILRGRYSAHPYPIE